MVKATGYDLLVKSVECFIISTTEAKSHHYDTLYSYSAAHEDVALNPCVYFGPL